MLNINIGGVPEHFNFPWLKCIENKAFQNIANVQWKNCPGGTGEMAEALEKDNIDIAIMLTEGCIKEIESGKAFKIIQKYVQSPLLWGIHVDKKSEYKAVKDLKGKMAAISRYNSGSHLMTHVLAERKSWDLRLLKFAVCQNLDGAIRAMKNNEADYLLWERFTTKPYVDNGTLKHLGDCPTPWPCFVIVAKDDFYTKNQKKIDEILSVLNAETKSLKNNDQLSDILSQRYKLNQSDVELWLSQTEWSQSPLKPEKIIALKNKLKKYHIIS